MLSMLEAGACTHPGAMVLKGSSWRPMRFPSGVGVMHHPHGVVLYDSGYSEAFHRATQRFPERFYAWITPVVVYPDETAVEQLRRQGIEADDVTDIVISHFHADHVAGLVDFPRARYWCLEAAWRGVRRRGRWCGVRVGFLRDLLPPGFESRLHFLDARPRVPLPGSVKPFDHGFDLMGDGRIIAVPLPGHARGHAGLLVDDVFLVGDAAWLTRSLEVPTPPHALTGLIFDDTRRYLQTLHGLHEVHARGEVRVVPSHCADALRRLR